jgi:quercetin dioxygenase-like cupin family protein
MRVSDGWLDAGLLLRRGEGRHIRFSGNLMTLKHATGWTFLESQLAPGHAPPLHLHRAEDEAFFLLEGTMRFRAGDEVFDVEPGDFVFVPMGVAHAFVVGPLGVRALQVATSSQLAAFIEDAGEPAGTDARPPAPEEVDHTAVARAAARHDMVVVGPPMA